jgi:hypothetical protein
VGWGDVAGPQIVPLAGSSRGPPFRSFWGFWNLTGPGGRAQIATPLGRIDGPVGGGQLGTVGHRAGREGSKAPKAPKAHRTMEALLCGLATRSDDELRWSQGFPGSFHFGAFGMTGPGSPAQLATRLGRIHGPVAGRPDWAPWAIKRAIRSASEGL